MNQLLSATPYLTKAKIYSIGLASSLSVLLYSLIFVKRRRKNSFDAQSSTNTNNVNATNDEPTNDGNTTKEMVFDERMNGLCNMGATCYLNSLLQTLFHLKIFRKSIWEAHTSNNRIIRALQSIFYHLQTSSSSSSSNNNSPTSTQVLLDSFGWSSSDAYVQHDVQELARMLIERIEAALTRRKNTNTNTNHHQHKNGETTTTTTTAEKFNIISRLFKGQFENYISCLHVQYTSRRIEDFYDLQLTVTPSVLESLRHYVKPDYLTGENKYYANDELKLQDAIRGQRFISFPPVLFIHLKRFEVVGATGAQRKVNARCEFSDEMDLGEFVVEENRTGDLTLSGENGGEKKKGGSGEKDFWKYTLQSVLIHSGSVNGGHYTCISNVSNDCQRKRWFLFNDEHVREIGAGEVFEPNFGSGVSSKSAYMLVYVQKRHWEHVMFPVDQSMIRPQLIERIERENSSSQCAIL